MGVGNSTYSGGSSGSFSFEPRFSLEDRRRTRWDHLGDTTFEPSPFLGGAGISDLSSHRWNQAFSNSLGMKYPLVPTHGTMPRGAFDSPSTTLGSHLSGPGPMSPLSEPLFDPIRGFHRTTFDIRSHLSEPKGFCSVFESSKNQDESAFGLSPDFMQDFHPENPVTIEEVPEPAPGNLHTSTTLSTPAFSPQPKDILDIEQPSKFAIGIFPTTDGTTLLKHGKLDAVSVLQAEGNGSSIRVQQDFSLLPNPALGKAESSVAFNKSGAGIGLNINSRGVDTVDTLWISDNSLLSSPGSLLGLEKTQLSGQLSRFHAGSIFDPVQRYAGTASLNAENFPHSFSASNSVTGLTNPGLLFMDNQVGFILNSGHTELKVGSHFDIFKLADTLSFGFRHISASDNIAGTVGVDKIDFKGLIAGQVQGRPMSRTLVALDLAVEGSKSWNEGSQTSVGVQASLPNRRVTAKGRHTETINQSVQVVVNAELSLSGGQSSKRVEVSIKPVSQK